FLTLLFPSSSNIITKMSQFSQWLHKQECKPGLVNSYYHAVICEKAEGILDNTNYHLYRIAIENFREFDYLEEIEKESKKGGPESTILRETLIDLLELVRPCSAISDNNYMNELRDFVTSLKCGKGDKDIHPKTKSFHEMKPKIKMWILYSLMICIYEHAMRNAPQRGYRHHPKPIGRDSTGNIYFIVNNRWLYVQYGSLMQELASEENKELSPFDKISIKLPYWKLLAESEKDWMRMAMLLESFDEEDIASEI
ncbi:hypothetical protein PMAYCL1PPCAC_21959, partial [Pristionchus mayeri]